MIAIKKILSAGILTCFGLLSAAQSILLPLGGNAWALDRNKGGLQITNNGVSNWTKPGEGFTAFIRVARPGTIKIWLDGNFTGSGSTLAVSLFGNRKEIVLQENSAPVFLGEWTVKDSGYVPIIVKGVALKGSAFPDVKMLKLEGTAITDKASYTKNNEGSFFHWGRRGPSVHLSYQLPKDIKAEWFYNEVTVPRGNDVVGSYFMADGFGEGYFGMQVNSPTERRILFSVWSPYATNNPKEIPDEQKIKLLKKGADVHAGEFGNEGSGGQSFLKYNWKATVTQKFLLHVQPDGDSHTIYTAYFYDNDKGQWLLIASFRRPKLATYLTHPYSFLENFSPDMGNVERRVFFGNQWVADGAGNWYELTKARFTADNTARKDYRKDYDGGAKGQEFYLRNCGFFNDYKPYDAMLERKPANNKPQIDLNQLP